VAAVFKQRGINVDPNDPMTRPLSGAEQAVYDGLQKKAQKTQRNSVSEGTSEPAARDAAQPGLTPGSHVERVSQGASQSAASNTFQPTFQKGNHPNRESEGPSEPAASNTPQLPFTQGNRPGNAREGLLGPAASSVPQGAMSPRSDANSENTGATSAGGPTFPALAAEAPHGTNEAGQASQPDSLDGTTGPQKRMNVGESGHHVPAVRKSEDRLFEIGRGNKSRPTFHFLSDEPGHDHWRLHDAERPFLGLRTGSFEGTDDELFDAYRKAYQGLDDIRVDVRSPDGKTLLSSGVSPVEGIDLIDNWLRQQGRR